MSHPLGDQDNGDAAQFVSDKEQLEMDADWDSEIVTGQKTKKRKISVDSLDHDQLWTEREAIIENLREQMCDELDNGGLAAVLAVCGWNADDAAYQFYADPSTTCEKAGVSSEPAECVNTKDNCAICLEKPEDPVAVSSCGHGHCRDCFSSYVQNALESSFADKLNCPSADCKMAIPENLMLELLPNSVQRQKFKRRLLDRYVFERKMKWCPAADCQQALRAEEGVEKVQCGSGHSFCYQCLAQEDHQPLPCSLTETWQLILEDSNNNAYINLNTRQCPNCGVKIEKNEGCNKITCTKCTKRFCWKCSKAPDQCVCVGFERLWDTSKPKTSNLLEYSAHCQKHYHFFMTKSSNILLHLSKVAGKLAEQFHLKSEVVEPLLFEVRQVLRDCYRSLAQTYAVAYFLNQGEINLQVELFLKSQEEFAEKVEDLSKFVEQDDPVSASDIFFKTIREKSQFLAKKREHLVRDVKERIASGDLTLKSESL